MILIRQAGGADIDALCSLHADAFGRGWSAAELVALLRDPAVIGLVAVPGRPNGQPEGFALARHAAGEAELLTIVVARDARRRGLGGALLRHLTAALRQRAVSELFLEVSEHNLPARRFYETFGFCEVGRRAGYYASEGGADALILRAAFDAIDAQDMRLHNLD